MKIVYLSSSQLPSSNANSVHVMKMCAAFARNHHDVLLYALEGKDGSPQDIFHIYGLEKNFHLKTVSVFMWKWLWNVFYLLKIFIDLKKSTFDLVELVKQITANFSSQARKKNIELKMKYFYG